MANVRSVNAPTRVVICGGGVIGASIAYYLSLRDVEVTVVERTGVANAASGHSGGFLALDWCAGTPVDALARRSFALHEELAATLGSELGLDWGYRRLDTLGVIASQRRQVHKLAQLAAPSWLGPNVAVHDRYGTAATTAHLHPGDLTQGLMSAAQAQGAQLRIGTVEGVTLAGDGRRVVAVLVDGESLETDAVVVAMGPWSMLACRWLPLPPVYGLKGHSLVYRYAPPDPYMLFVEVETESGAIETPEVVPRTNGTTYVSGISGQEPVPPNPAHVTADPGALEQLQAMTRAFAPELAKSELLVSHACFRPVSVDGLPLMGRIPGVQGAFVATGHGVWGMLNGPATGEAMAELIMDGRATTVDISAFDPARLAPH